MGLAKLLCCASGAHYTQQWAWSLLSSRETYGQLRELSQAMGQLDKEEVLASPGIVQEAGWRDGVGPLPEGAEGKSTHHLALMHAHVACLPRLCILEEEDDS